MYAIGGLLVGWLLGNKGWVQLSRTELGLTLNSRSAILGNAQQREFVSYVLRNYVEVGVDELDVAKLSTLLTAKKGSIHAAQQQLGNVEDIQRTFIDFQEHLYKRVG